jgi:hypothetical protein
MILLALIVILLSPGQLSWQATNTEHFCKWGVVFGGKNFVVYHIMRVSLAAEQRDTIVMTHSDEIAIDDTQTPYIALLVYMMLSSDTSQTALAEILDLSPPTPATVVDDREQMDRKTRGGTVVSGELDYTRVLVSI